MSTVLTDSTTMLRRNVLRMRRYPSLTLMLIGMPIVFLLLFVYVLGGTLGAGLPGVEPGGVEPGGGGRGAYLEFVMPGILLMTVAAVAQGTAVSVAMDLHEGVVARFRTMAIARSSVLTGHVLGAMLQTALALVVVSLVGVALGFRPVLDPLAWAGAAALLLALAFAVTWLCVALGLVSDSVETASNAPMPLIFLPFLGSGFVPTESMPGALRWFADHQPFTATTDAVRDLLLTGSVQGADVVASLAWSALIAALAAWWAVRRYARQDA